MGSLNRVKALGKNIPLLLFAKAPIEGKVKTRLHSHCSPKQAADIAEILLDASLKRVCEYWNGPVYLSTWLDHQHPVLRRLSAHYDVPIMTQCEGDLGCKMHHAFENNGYPMAIMGSDAPHTSAQTLIALYQNLLNGRGAIGPSLDGGYYIIGLTEPAPFLFEDMPWGTSSVFSLTRQRSHQAQLVLTELESLQDVDEWHHVLGVKDQLPNLADYLTDQRIG